MTKTTSFLERAVLFFHFIDLYGGRRLKKKTKTNKHNFFRDFLRSPQLQLHSCPFFPLFFLVFNDGRAKRPIDREGRDSDVALSLR